MFFIEQLELHQTRKHARRYSTNTVKTAFLWQLTSTALYKKLQSFFCCHHSVGCKVYLLDLQYLAAALMLNIYLPNQSLLMIKKNGYFIN